MGDSDPGSPGTSPKSNGNRSNDQDLDKALNSQQLQGRATSYQKQIKASSGGSFACCGMLKSRPKAVFDQTLVVLRHSERKDYVDRNYPNTAEGQAWPHDAPITQRGVQLAQEVAMELRNLHRKACFTAVASSPYLRCVETAAEVAKHLRLPVMIDQEIGEVRDQKTASNTTPAHRSPAELKQLVDRLGLKVLNPILEDGSLKLFGKAPVYPERLEQAKNRYIVRIENYVQQSVETRQNLIIITHADAVAAALVMFERSSCHVEKMEFCARITCNRKVDLDKLQEDKKKKKDNRVYADHWKVEWKAMGAEVWNITNNAAYFERMHLETVEETEQMVVKRKEKRTATDKLFEETVKGIGAGYHSEEEEAGARNSQASVIPDTVQEDGDAERQAELENGRSPGASPKQGGGRNKMKNQV
mmetsp:Transcript_34295/g.80169  ORF Transcript_34295/g.80169 Transcript_34295/m.80169 type:complete len:417 (+) Transcript_34295:250-1500(+)